MQNTFQDFSLQNRLIRMLDHSKKTYDVFQLQLILKFVIIKSTTRDYILVINWPSALYYEAFTQEEMVYRTQEKMLYFSSSVMNGETSLR